jgi:hypothetical protein
MTMRAAIVHAWRDERGSALLFTTVMLICLLMFGALAIDLAYFMTAKGELQRSVDAAALAAAGKLAFDSSVFVTVRNTAIQYAGLNPIRDRTGGSVNLAGNDIELGVWQQGAFTRWDAGTDPNGQQVNAVRCRWTTPLPMSFLGLLGFQSLSLSAMSTAISNPPAVVGCDTPLLPLAVTQCSFQDGGTGAYSSQGCGTALSFIRSQRLCDNSPGSPQACNTGTWASLDGSPPSASYLRNAIQNAGNPGGACGASIVTSGQPTQTNNGMVNSVFQDFAEVFLSRRTPTLSEDVCPATGCDGGPPTYPRQGGGWEVAVVVIKTACPPGPMSGEAEVLTFARFVVTQVFNRGDGCVINPNPDPQAQAYCYNPDGTPRRDNDLRAIFGYFRCDRLGEVASREPLPRSALATRLRLVQ